MNDGLFHFKRFSVAHSRSSMKVGVDGVLIGAWADCQGERLLDVGTGCGLIALMLAQRNPLATVVAIDIDSDSVEEASLNFSKSEWSGRMSARLISFSALVDSGERFDRIVSNPPYFNSGVTDFTTARNVARHQGTLSPRALVRGAAAMLTESGLLSMIVPAEFLDDVCAAADEEGFRPVRVCLVRTTAAKHPKRVMIELGKGPRREIDSDCLSMFDPSGNPTCEYRSLGKDFYLKF